MAEGWDLPGYYAQSRWWRNNPPVPVMIGVMANIKRHGHVKRQAKGTAEDFIRGLIGMKRRGVGVAVSELKARR